MFNYINIKKGHKANKLKSKYTVARMRPTCERLLGGKIEPLYPKSRMRPTHENCRAVKLDLRYFIE